MVQKAATPHEASTNRTAGVQVRVVKPVLLARTKRQDLLVLRTSLIIRLPSGALRSEFPEILLRPVVRVNSSTMIRHTYMYMLLGQSAIGLNTENPK